MTLEEIKSGIQELREEDRLYLQAYLLHLSRVNSEENSRELARRNAEMDAGRKISREDLLNAHKNVPTGSE